MRFSLYQYIEDHTQDTVVNSYTVVEFGPPKDLVCSQLIPKNSDFSVKRLL